MTRCEDYPCCGHTDGLGCNWTYTPAARAYDEEHVMCDHAAGVCDAYYDDEDEDHEPDDCPYGGCSACDDYDPTPTHQWEVTTPPEVYDTDDREDFLNLLND